MVKIVLTGFGKFGKIIENPTTRLVELLKNNDQIHDFRVIEVSAGAVRETMEPLWEDAANSQETTVFVHLGVSEKAPHILLEKVGYNVANFSIPDERGWVANNATIVEKEEDSFETTLPIEKMEAQLLEKSCNVSISTDPGRYICNYIYYLSLTHSKHSANKNQHSLFVHVPLFSTIAEEEQLRTIEALISTIQTIL